MRHEKTLHADQHARDVASGRRMSVRQGQWTVQGDCQRGRLQGSASPQRVDPAAEQVCASYDSNSVTYPPTSASDASFLPTPEPSAFDPTFDNLDDLEAPFEDSIPLDPALSACPNGFYQDLQAHAGIPGLRSLPYSPPTSITYTPHVDRNQYLSGLDDVRTPESRTHFIRHPNGQITHIRDDNFTDPWRPCETILIYPGFAQYSVFWYRWIPILSRHYRVLRLDPRGHGLSGYPRSEELLVNGGTYDYSVDTICNEVIDTIDQLRLQKVHVLCEGTGAVIGQVLAARHPDRLQSLILCAPSDSLPSTELDRRSFRSVTLSAACRELGSRGLAEILSTMPGTAPMADPHYRRWWIDQIAVSDAEGLAGYADFLYYSSATPQYAEQDIRIPVLTIATAKSAASDDVRAGARSKRVVLQSVGDDVYTRRVEDCQTAVLDFLRTADQ